MKRCLVMGDGGLDLGAPNRDSDMAFWNSYLPQSEEQDELRIEPAEHQQGISGLKSLVQSVKGETERNAISTALEQAGWNRKAAARLLKVSYRTLLYKIEQYHMNPPSSDFSGYGNGGSLRERHLQRE